MKYETTKLYKIRKVPGTRDRFIPTTFLFIWLHHEDSMWVVKYLRGTVVEQQHRTKHQARLQWERLVAAGYCANGMTRQKTYSRPLPRISNMPAIPASLD